MTPPPPASVSAPLEYYVQDGADFPEDLYAIELEKQLKQKEIDDALRNHVIINLIYVIRFFK